MLIHFCETCRLRIPPAELEAHTAVFIDENMALCAKCAAARKPQTQGGITKQLGEGIVAASAASSSARLGRANLRPGGTVATQAAAIPAQRGLKPAIWICAGGLVLFVAGVLFVFSGGDSPSASGNSATAGQEEKAKPAGLPASQKPSARLADKTEPGNADRKTPSWLSTNAPPPAGEHEPPTAAGAAPHSKEVTEAAPSGLNLAPAVEAPKFAPIVVKDAPNERIWVEDALPPGANASGTLKADSWKWVKQPGPVYSGTLSHTMRVYEGQEKPTVVQQHFFQDANPPLPVNPWDVLFCYVYLDPKDPPKEVMLEWQSRGSWEHRAYWGEDLIPMGNNLSPSRLPAGPLPKPGEWVRLEVRAGEIGIEFVDEPVTGWSFDELGGTVYFDRAGVASKPKPAVQAGAVAAVAAKGAGAPTAGYIASSLKKWSVKDLQGGGDCPNFMNKGKNGKAIWGKRTNLPTLSATCELGFGRYGPGTLIITSLRHDRKEPCLIAILVNGQEIFSGPNPATTWEWAEQKFTVPSGLLRTGKNEIRINNTEDSNKMGASPWFMANAMELQGALLPEFPPIVSESQRSAFQAYDHTYELLAKKDLEPAARLEQALRAAKSAAGPELGPLISALEKAQALYGQALANMAKTPPAEAVQVAKLKLTGNIARVAGNKAFIKSEGIEMPVNVGLLPQSVFLKALACDESKPAGLSDKAACLFGLGNAEEARELLKPLKKENVPAWAALFDQRAALDRLLKFESLVATVEEAMKNARPADALATLETLRKEYADLVEANKERMAYLGAAAEGPKK